MNKSSTGREWVPWQCEAPSSITREWELDTVVSSRGKSKGCIATFVERQTRFYVAIKIENRSATEMYRAISELYELFPKDTFKTYTVD